MKTFHSIKCKICQNVGPGFAIWDGNNYCKSCLQTMPVSFQNYIKRHKILFSTLNHDRIFRQHITMDYFSSKKNCFFISLCIAFVFQFILFVSPETQNFWPNSWLIVILLVGAIVFLFSYFISVVLFNLTCTVEYFYPPYVYMAKGKIIVHYCKLHFYGFKLIKKVIDLPTPKFYCTRGENIYLDITEFVHHLDLPHSKHFLTDVDQNNNKYYLLNCNVSKELMGIWKTTIEYNTIHL